MLPSEAGLVDGSDATVVGVGDATDVGAGGVTADVSGGATWVVSVCDAWVVSVCDAWVVSVCDAWVVSVCADLGRIRLPDLGRIRLPDLGRVLRGGIGRRRGARVGGRRGIGRRGADCREHPQARALRGRPAADTGGGTKRSRLDGNGGRSCAARCRRPARPRGGFGGSRCGSRCGSCRRRARGRGGRARGRRRGGGRRSGGLRGRGGRRRKRRRRRRADGVGHRRNVRERVDDLRALARRGRVARGERVPVGDHLRRGDGRAGGSASGLADRLFRERRQLRRRVELRNRERGEADEGEADGGELRNRGGDRGVPERRVPRDVRNGETDQPDQREQLARSAKTERRQPRIVNGDGTRRHQISYSPSPPTGLPCPLAETRFAHLRRQFKQRMPMNSPIVPTIYLRLRLTVDRRRGRRVSREAFAREPAPSAREERASPSRERAR